MQSQFMCREGVLFCLIHKLGENKVYCDELYSHKEESATSDESSTSSYEYEPEDNEQSMGIVM